MRFQSLSIKWQFMLIISLVAMPFIILSVYNLRSEKVREIEQAKRVAINTARSIGVQQKFTETSTKQLLALFSKLPEIQNGKPDSTVLNDLFAKILAENSQFAIFLAALPNGNIYAAAFPFKPFSITDRKYYKDVLRTRAFTVGEFAISRITNKQVIHYAFPVFDKNDSLKLILIASYDLSQYQNILSVSNLDPESDFAFYDFAGKVLYHSVSHLKYSGIKGNPEIQEVIQTGNPEGSYISEGDDGNKRLCSYIRIKAGDETPYMYIVVSTPIKKAFKVASRNFYINICLILLAIIVSVSILVYYKVYIFRKADKLLYTADQLRSGELSSRTGLDYSHGELGLLAHALDNMAISLQKREIERDTAISSLKILSERFEIAASAAKVGIWEWDLITQKVFWDKLMFDLYQINPEDFKATIPDWMKRLISDDAARFEEELHQSIRQKKNHKTSFRILDRNRGVKNIRCYFNTILDKNGKPIRIVGVNWDITERILLENELTKAKESAEAKILQVKLHLADSLEMLRELELQLKDETDTIDSKANKERNCLNSVSRIMENLQNELVELSQ